ncbi:MAG: hypothetical protein KAJ33_06105 [Thermoplasmata archaeon]|nr:hypothetical protein [Thermoplasmata archaeon]
MLSVTDLGKFFLGTSPEFNVVVTDEDGNESDPTTMVIRIDNPDGTTAQADTAMTNDSVGNYSYTSYTIPAESSGQIGEYSARAKATGSDDRVTPQRFTFTAVKSI